MNDSNSSASETFLAEAVIGLYILCLVVAIWLAIKAFELVARVMVAHPNNKPMWGALGLFLVSLLAASLTGWQYEALDALVPLTGTGLVATAKVVELYYDQLFQRELNRHALADAVVNQPWWQVA